MSSNNESEQPMKKYRCKSCQHIPTNKRIDGYISTGHSLAHISCPQCGQHTLASQPSYARITYHRDSTVTVWDTYVQFWTRTGNPSGQLLASLPSADRERVIQHCTRGGEQ